MKPRIELRHLSYFVQVADELHFGRAAQRIGIAQAPLSQQVRQLEDRIGFRLFNRTTRSVALTPQGKIFLKHARDVLGAMDYAIEQSRTLTGEGGTISIGAISAAMYSFLPDVIAEFRRRFPKVLVHIEPLTTPERFNPLINGDFHVAFIRPLSSPGFMKTEHIAWERPVLVMREDHALAKRGNLKLLDLAEENFIGYYPSVGTNFYPALVDHLRQAGLRPKIIQEASHPAAISVLVHAGVGIAILPEWARTLPIKGLVYLPLPEAPPLMEVVMAWPSGEPSPVVRHFLDITRRVTRREEQARRALAPA